MVDAETQVEQAFPELAEIEDDALRQGVEKAWTLAIEENGVDELAELPWYPPVQKKHDIGDEYLVSHVRDVVAGSHALAEMLDERRGEDIDYDVVVAGALVHDVSKLYECHGWDETEIGDLLGHPYYGVYVVGAAGLPPIFAHIALSHSNNTGVEPATLEAEIIKRADEAAAAAIYNKGVDDLRDG